MPLSIRQQDTKTPEDELTKENINDLARIIASEARGLNETAQIMVAWTVVNRMKQHHFTRVSSVWGHNNYSHHHMATSTSLHLAEKILDGAALDISHGATHFYSPAAMPKEGDTTSSAADVRGGLESIPGVTKNGRPVQNYRPGWAKNYGSIRIPGIQDKDFKFYRLP